MAKNTAKNKYGKMIIPAPIKMPEANLQAFEGGKPIGYLNPSFYAHEGELNCDISLGFHYITEEFTEHAPHTHEGQQIMCFIGGNPADITDFDAEIEIALGPEGEVHTITSPSVVSIPPGFLHAPLTFKRVGKPIIFWGAILQRKYATIGEDEEFTKKGIVRRIEKK